MTFHILCSRSGKTPVMVLEEQLKQQDIADGVTPASQVPQVQEKLPDTLEDYEKNVNFLRVSVGGMDASGVGVFVRLHMKIVHTCTCR